MGKLRREYPILCDGEATISVVPSGCNYVESGEALWELLWSHVPTGSITEALKIAHTKRPAQGVDHLLEAAKQRAQEAPPCKPEQCLDKGKMAVKVLLATDPTECPRGWRSMLFQVGERFTSPWYQQIVGVYRVPRGTTVATRSAATDGIPEVLAAIRDAGGECLAGEPLPEKQKQTWPKVARQDAVPSCGKCGCIVLHNATECYRCNVALSGEVPWKPYPPNEEC